MIHTLYLKNFLYTFCNIYDYFSYFIQYLVLEFSSMMTDGNSVPLSLICGKNYLDLRLFSGSIC